MKAIRKLLQGPKCSRINGIFIEFKMKYVRTTKLQICLSLKTRSHLFPNKLLARLIFKTVNVVRKSAILNEMNIQKAP